MGAKSSSHLDAARFSADLDSWHLGSYAVRQDGPLALRLGAIYSSHDGQNKRSVKLLDYTEQLRANYNANSQTVFSEMGYQLGTADLSVGTLRRPRLPALSPRRLQGAGWPDRAERRLAKPTEPEQHLRSSPGVAVSVR